MLPRVVTTSGAIAVYDRLFHVKLSITSMSSSVGSNGIVFIIVVCNKSDTLFVQIDGNVMKLSWILNHESYANAYFLSIARE